MHSQRRLHHLAICRKDGTFMPSRGSGFCLRRCVGLQSPMLVLQHQTEEGRGLWIATSASRMHTCWRCCIRRPRRCQRQMEGPKWTTIGILQRRCSVTRRYHNRIMIMGDGRLQLIGNSRNGCQIPWHDFGQWLIYIEFTSSNWI